MAANFWDMAAELYTQKEAIDKCFHIVLPAIKCCNNCAHCVERAVTLGTPMEDVGQMSCDLADTAINAGRFLVYAETYRENDCNYFEQVEQDDYLKEQWRELEDVLVFEDCAQSGLRLNDDWWLFKRGTAVNDIWHYFDQLYTGGVAQLMYEN